MRTDFTDIFGEDIFIVGGCVRDYLLGIDDNDVDLASAMEPEKFKKKCQKLGFKTFDTGLKHGTVSVRIDNHIYEHTTFRKDVSCDGRNATIQYSKTLKEDLSRRDFTVNAMAMNKDSEIIDEFGGKNDLLKKKILKTVGNAFERFEEDYLRIIRAARFASRLKLTPTAEVIKAANKLSPNILKHVSVERVTAEFKKAIAASAGFLFFAEQLGFLEHVLPFYYENDILNSRKLEKTLAFFRQEEKFNEIQFFAILFFEADNEKKYDSHLQLEVFSIKKITSLCRDFKLSNKERNSVCDLVKFRDIFEQKLSLVQLRRIVRLLKLDFQELIDFRLKLLKCSKNIKNNICNIKIDLEKVYESINQPYITGADLEKLGISPGPRYKEILDYAGELQAQGQPKDKILSLITVEK